MLPPDLICTIVRKLPFCEQYQTATETQLPEEHSLPFAEEFIYMSETISHIRDDLPNALLTKNVWLDPPPSKLDIKFKTPIYSLPRPTTSLPLHKLATWQSLYKAGHVGQYHIELTNHIRTQFETFEIFADLTCSHPDNPVQLDLSVCAFDHNHVLIMDGWRTFYIPQHPTQSTLPTHYYLYPTTPHHVTYAGNSRIVTVDTCQFRQDSWNLTYSNELNYNVGFSKEQLTNFLF